MNMICNKQTHLKACNFVNNKLQHRCFLVNIAKFLRTPILKNICERLLLQLDSDRICSFKEHIQSLRGEISFLREEIKKNKKKLSFTSCRLNSH